MSSKDVLDRVDLTPAAVSAWHQMVQRVVALPLKVVDPREIPDEQAEVMEDGSLRLFVRGLVSMTIPPEHWRWSVRVN